MNACGHCLHTSVQARLNLVLLYRLACRCYYIQQDVSDALHILSHVMSDTAPRQASPRLQPHPNGTHTHAHAHAHVVVVAACAFATTQAARGPRQALLRHGSLHFASPTPPHTGRSIDSATVTGTSTSASAATAIRKTFAHSSLARASTTPALCHCAPAHLIYSPSCHPPTARILVRHVVL